MLMHEVPLPWTEKQVNEIHSHNCPKEDQWTKLSRR
jgi:hypothetical protein